MTLFFDLDDTLFDHLHAERMGARDFLHEHRHLFPWFPDEFAARWHRLSEHHFDRHARGEITHAEQRRDRWQGIWAEAGLRLPDADVPAVSLRFLAHYERHWRAFPDVAPCLETLAGRPLGMISNGLVTQQRDKLERLGLLERFTPLVISEEVGVTKPHPRIFHEACRRAGKAPADCLYVGDKWATDALAARDAGLKAVWLNRLGEDRPSEGVSVIRTLSELPELVRI